MSAPSYLCCAPCIKLHQDRGTTSFWDHIPVKLGSHLRQRTKSAPTKKLPWAELLCVTRSPSWLAKHACHLIVWVSTIKEYKRHASASGMQSRLYFRQIHQCDKLTRWSMSHSAWTMSPHNVALDPLALHAAPVLCTTSDLHSRCMGFLFILVWRPSHRCCLALLAFLEASRRLNS